MNRSGGADRPGPAPRACAGNPKARSGAASPQGLHGPLLSGCGQGLAPHRFIGKRRAVLRGQARGSPQRSGSSASVLSTEPAPTRQRPRRRALPSSIPAPCRSKTCGSHEAAPSPSPSSAMRYGKGLGASAQADARRRARLAPAIGTLSARAARGLARPDSRRRRRRSPRPWRASAHRGRCQAA